MSDIAAIQSRINDEADSKLRERLRVPYEQFLQAIGGKTNLFLTLAARDGREVQVQANHALDKLVSLAFDLHRDSNRQQATELFMLAVSSFEKVKSQEPTTL